jgi:UDP-N-acetylglucosamine 1-carboxyvinyltransferase
MTVEHREEEHFQIEGGEKLHGSVRISGSKNASLAVMAAALLTSEDVTVQNVPWLADTQIMSQVLSGLGAAVTFDNGVMHINARDISRFETPYELMNRMRASIYVMGPLLARFGHARVAMPGGCAIGSRPINFHLAGFEQMGVEMNREHGDIDAHCSKLKGARIYLDFPSVGATVNLMTAAVLAEGETVIENAAEEPHILDLAWFLKSLGGHIKGAGTKTIVVEGVPKLHGCTHLMVPDQIEAGTFMVAAAITNGTVTLEEMRTADLKPIIVKLKEAGVSVTEGKNTLKVSAKKRCKPLRITTMPHPGFPTDMQAQMMALVATADGVSAIKETVWENRFMHVAELIRMGADITIQGNTAIVNGVPRLAGAKVVSTDLRAGAALVLAGLAADNTTIVYDIDHIDRGYENFEGKLTALGAKIKRVKPIGPSGA